MDDAMNRTDAAAAPLARVVLGVTGGIAAYKAAELTRLLVKDGIVVDVVMTAAATQFVTPMTFQALSGRPVLTDLWQSGAGNAMGHIAISRGADAILVAPASADFLAKLAHGAADDLLSTLCLARECPLLVAPAMNRQMWSNVRDPAQRRRNSPADGVAILGPGEGELACNETGDGRMLEPEELHAALIASRQPKVLAGKRVLMTAGPTFEAIDPVRGITNFELGQDGIRARAGGGRCRRGSDAGRRSDDACDSRERRPGRRRQRRADGRRGARTCRAVRRVHRRRGSRRLRARRCQRPQDQEERRRADAQARADDRHSRDDRQAQQRTVLRRLRRREPRRDGTREEKRRRKNVPLLIANRAQDALGSDVNEVTLLDASGAHPLPKMDKQALARRLVGEIANRLP
jgi:phosphopantothenoylcysteine decarboxylase/phosphopantothenate--cysteine ligase